VWVIDAIEAAAALGSTNVLLAFFSNGDLRLRTEAGGRNWSETGGFRSYDLNPRHVTRVVEALRQIAHRAEEAGVVICLENTITAAQNLEIIEQVGSPALKVYYDVGNSWGNGYDVPGEIRMLGNEMICEVHLKDWNTPMLGSEGAMVDMPQNEMKNLIDRFSFFKELFDPIDDNNTLKVSGRWTRVGDQKTWIEILRQNTQSTDNIISVWLGSRSGFLEIIGPDEQLFGYLVHEKMDLVAFKIIDRNTMQIFYSPQRTDGP